MEQVSQNVFLTRTRNYTGDILNFGLAKEKYASKNPDSAKLLRIIIVSDDVSVGRTQGSIVGRRGLAGTVLVHKLAGALAQKGASLEQVYSLASFVASHLATIGVGLEHCHVRIAMGFGNFIDELDLGPWNSS